MIALKLTNVKACMSHLLLMDTFDSFLLIEGEIIFYRDAYAGCAPCCVRNRDRIP